MMKTIFGGPEFLQDSRTLGLQAVCIPQHQFILRVEGVNLRRLFKIVYGLVVIAVERQHAEIIVRNGITRSLCENLLKERLRFVGLSFVIKLDRSFESRLSKRHGSTKQQEQWTRSFHTLYL